MRPHAIERPEHLITRLQRLNGRACPRAVTRTDLDRALCPALVTMALIIPLGGIVHSIYSAVQLIWSHS